MMRSKVKAGSFLGIGIDLKQPEQEAWKIKNVKLAQSTCWGGGPDDTVLNAPDSRRKREFIKCFRCGRMLGIFGKKLPKKRVKSQCHVEPNYGSYVITNVKIPLSDAVVIVFRQPYKNDVKAPMLIGLLTFLMGLMFSPNVFAECGGYVIIGNKSKLRELQKDGFTFGSKMESHSARSHDSGFRDARYRNKFASNAESNIGSFEGISNGMSRLFSTSIPPCTGPQCGSNPTPAAPPESFVIEYFPSKPLKSSTAGYEKHSLDSYFGFSEYSENPFLYKLLIDRPPQ